MPKKLSQEVRIDSARCRSAPVSVKGLSPHGPADQVERHIPWPCVEGKDLIQRRSHYGQVGDPSDVEKPSDPVRRPEKEPVNQGDERGTFATGRHVSRPEVRDDGEPGPLRDHRRLPELKCRAAGMMTGRMTVRPYEVHIFGCELSLGNDSQGRLGKGLAESGVEVGHGLGVRFGKGQDLLPKPLAERNRLKREKSDARPRPGPDDCHQRRVHPVTARPGHESDNATGRELAERQEPSQRISGQAVTAPGAGEADPCAWLGVTRPEPDLSEVCSSPVPRSDGPQPF